MISDILWGNDDFNNPSFECCWIFKYLFQNQRVSGIVLAAKY